MQLLKNLKDNRIFRTAVIILLAGLAAISLYQGIRNAASFSQDFQWDAAKALTMRLDPYELSMTPQDAGRYPDLAAFYRMFTDRGLNQKMEANQFPSLLALLFPMTVFDPQTAKIVWLIFNILFTAGIVFLLKGTFFDDADTYLFAVSTLLMIAGTPYRNQLGVGQHTLFSFFFFMLAVYIDRKGMEKEKRAVIPTALCLFVSYFKYTLTAPLALYFVYKRRIKELVISVLGHVALTFVFAFWLNKSFMDMITEPLKVASALTSEGSFDLGALLGSPFAFISAGLIFAVIFVIAITYPAGRDKELFALLILWSLVLTYHRTYDFFALTAAGAAFISIKGDDKSGFDTVMGISYVVILLMVYFMLRVFDENAVSLTVCGICYYAFTIAASISAVKKIKDERIRVNG